MSSLKQCIQDNSTKIQDVNTQAADDQQAYEQQDLEAGFHGGGGQHGGGGGFHPGPAPRRIRAPPASWPATWTASGRLAAPRPGPPHPGPAAWTAPWPAAWTASRPAAWAASWPASRSASGRRQLGPWTGHWGDWGHPGWGYGNRWAYRDGRWLWWGWAPWVAGGVACDAYYANAYRECSDAAWQDNTICVNNCAAVGYPEGCNDQCSHRDHTTPSTRCEFSYRGLLELRLPCGLAARRRRDLDSVT